VAPALLAVAVLLGVSVWGLVHSRNSATFNNVAFATLHVSVLLAGAWPALRRPERPATASSTSPLASEAAGT
jgi:cellulose synthase (UDP-forming)